MYDAKVIQFIKAALECSVYVAPLQYGLTFDELVEVGKSVDMHEGEIRDSVRYASNSATQGRWQPADNSMWDQFIFDIEPDYRDPAAFNFLVTELQELRRKLGASKAALPRDVLIARGVDRKLDEQGLQAALAIMLLVGRLTEKDGVVSFAPGRENFPLPSDPANRSSIPKRSDTQRARIYEAVRDVVLRRSDRRAPSADAFTAFRDALKNLGHAEFTSWWIQQVSELRQLAEGPTPVALTVAAAALVEGALTFSVKHARALDLPVFKSKDFDGPPNRWKIDDLVASAACGGEFAIISTALRPRVDLLIKSRQRIHAGRMLSDFPTGVPDYRPEEARDARAAAELTVRAVLDWLALLDAKKSSSSQGTP